MNLSGNLTQVLRDGIFFGFTLIFLATRRGFRGRSMPAGTKSTRTIILSEGQLYSLTISGMQSQDKETLTKVTEIFSRPIVPTALL
jgi:hypothetical protein